jgi:hypothetical protein
MRGRDDQQKLIVCFRDAGVVVSSLKPVILLSVETVPRRDRMQKVMDRLYKRKRLPMKLVYKHLLSRSVQPPPQSGGSGASKLLARTVQACDG